MQAHPYQLAFTIVQVAEVCSIGTDTVRRLIDEGVFRARKIGSARNSKILVTADSVRAWLNSETPPAEHDRVRAEVIRPSEAAPIALVSLPYLDADERKEIARRWKSGELVTSSIGGRPVLIEASSK